MGTHEKSSAVFIFSVCKDDRGRLPPFPFPHHRLPEASGLLQWLREHHRVPDLLPRGDCHLLSLLPWVQTRRLGVCGVLTQPHLVVQPTPVPFSGR